MDLYLTFKKLNSYFFALIAGNKILVIKNFLECQPNHKNQIAMQKISHTPNVSKIANKKA